MKKISLFLFTCLQVLTACSQKQSFDIMTYTAPSGWTSTDHPGLVSYSIVNKDKGTWCQLGLIKSSPSLGNIDKDFTDDWQQLVVKPYNVNGPAQAQPPADADGWKVKAGVGKFTYNNAPAIVLLTTLTGFDIRVAVVATTNSQDYMADIEKFLSSIDINTASIKNDNPSVTTPAPAANASTNDGFAFNTTTFDDGWTSSIQNDWVEVKKDQIRVLLHYPRPMKDHKAFPAEPVTAWDTLVSPRYRNLTGFKKTYINTYKFTEMAMGNVTEAATGSPKFVLIFRRSGSAWIEVIAPDKAAFVQEFKFDPEMIRWDSDADQTDMLANMVGRNRFAVTAQDLDGTGEWRQRYSSNTFWANYYTGAYEGISTYSSSEWFVFGKGQSYSWKLVAANSYGGQTKFASAKGAGTFSSPNNWQLFFSDIEGKAKTFDAYFSAVRDGRVLWMNDANYPGSGVFTGFSPAK